MLKEFEVLYPLVVFYITDTEGHSGAVVTHSPPTSEVSGSNPRPYVGKLVVAYR